MIDEFYCDNELYLKYLNIEKDQLPLRGEQIDKQELAKLVELHFRKLVRTYHPDYGGNSENFEFLLKSKRFLLDGNSEGKDFALSVDDNNFEFYDSKSLASRLGNQLFELISSWSQDLGLKPLFKPENELDVYEWIFQISDTDFQLSLNVQNFDKDLFELQDESSNETQLSVLVCLFIPSKKLSTIRNELDESVTLQFYDLILLESSNSKKILDYFATKINLENDLDLIKTGEFKSKFNSQLKVKRTEKAIEQDKVLIDQLQNLKIFNTDFNPNAADFIDQL